MANQYQLKDIRNWTAYLEHLQATLKKFDAKAILANELFIYYFQDSLWLLISAYFDKRDRNLNAWQEVIKRGVNAEVKMIRQLTSIARESDTYCFHNYQPMKEDFKDKRDSKVKKAPNTFTNHRSNGSQSSQSSSTLGQSAKKSSYPH